MRVNLVYLTKMVKVLLGRDITIVNTENIDRVEIDLRAQRDAIARIERDLGIYPPRKIR